MTKIAAGMIIITLHRNVNKLFRHLTDENGIHRWCMK